MKRIRFIGFTLLLMTVLMVSGTPVQAGGFHRFTAIAANPLSQLLDAAAEVWQWLMADDPAGRSDGAGSQPLEKADPTPTPPASTSSAGGPFPPGGGCIDPNGIYIC